jgi:hypothetical protein
MWLVSTFSSFVIPAKAGIQGCKSVPVALDPSPDLIRGFRRGDGQEESGHDDSHAIIVPDASVTAE